MAASGDCHGSANLFVFLDVLIAKEIIWNFQSLNLFDLAVYAYFNDDIDFHNGCIISV